MDGWIRKIVHKVSNLQRMLLLQRAQYRQERFPDKLEYKPPALDRF
jgi:hypothetical protein